MEVAQIALNFPSPVESIPYLSNNNLLDFDLLLINSDYLLSLGHGHKPEVLQWKTKLEEFSRIKPFPIVYTVPISKTQYNVKLSDVAPVPAFITTSESGRSVRVVENTPFTGIMEKYFSQFRYHSYILEPPGKTILETVHKKNTLAFYGGNCLFLPISDNKLQTQEFLDHLVKAIRSASQGLWELELPEWANGFSLPQEQSLKSAIRKFTEEINNLKVMISDQERNLNNLLRHKLLFTAAGKILENEVARLLRDLGFEILNSEEGREDLIVKFDKKIAVIEIKGTRKSAAEKHAAQLEKWSANYLAENGNSAKPILIINTFRDQPLHLRPEISFPPQMLKYSEARSHCLITTIQLLTLFFHITENPSSKELLIDEMFDTVGVYERFPNWKDFIVFDQISPEAG